MFLISYSMFLIFQKLVSNNKYSITNNKSMTYGKD